MRIGVADDPAAHHVVAVSDPRRQVPHRGGGHAHFVEIGEAADPRVVLADARVVQNDAAQSSERR